MDTNYLKNTFSKVINDYDAARPTYPKELYDKVLAFSGIGTNAEVLEVGAGTGQATDLFLQGDFTFDLLEVSDEQVAFLKQKYGSDPKVTVKKDYFEQHETEKKYDLIYSATAFHWVDSWVGYPKAWEMLKSGGTLAVFWHMSSVTYYDTGIFVGLNAIKKKYLPEESLGFDAEGIQKVKERRIQQIQSGGCFGAPEVYEYRWTDTYDADRYVTLLNTYSGTQTLAEEARIAYLEEVRAYINANGGTVDLPQHVMLYLVRKPA
ncbi:MAG: class I SAM-dependent methyltransferase [Lachnospiraceae bacterium]|nr:class I SAM-dependent methyltransferase [Lachnospiraceae bacterium]